jgi:membrane-associated phospholipid phosphatase
VSPYVLVTLAPFLCRTNRVLRRFMLAGLVATAIGHLTFLIIPAIATPRPFEPHGLLGAMMLWDRKMDLCNGTAAFPSFHVVWAFLGAGVFASRWPRTRNLAWLWAAAVSLSCVFTGMHASVDIVAGFALFLLTWNCQPLCRWLNQLPVFARNGGAESSEFSPPTSRSSDAWGSTQTAPAPS